MLALLLANVGDTGYGRGWALLRGRGGLNHTPGAPCDPRLNASTCTCSADISALQMQPQTAPLPPCTPSTACNRPLNSREPTTNHASDHVGGSVAIVVALGFNSSLVRFYHSGKPIEAYLSQARLALRLVLSLRRAATALPIALLVSGERWPPVETLFSSHGVAVLPAAADSLVRVPRWASPWALGSFAKLKALALVQYERVIVLDTDTIALRNFDSVIRVPPPAFVYRFKCHPRLELSPQFMVLRPSQALASHARQLLEPPATGTARDNCHSDECAEQAVWRRLFDQVTELPAAYGALKTSGLAEGDWPHVFVVHDPNLLRKVRGARVCE